jgi:cytochrome c oxidase subunit 2
MKTMLRPLASVALAACAALAACTGPRFVAVPTAIDPATVPQQTVVMTAEKYQFTPEEVHVKQGTLVTLEVKSIEGTHGIAIGDFGIDVPLEEGVTKSIRFYAAMKGEYGFRCSHFCGIGHLSMTGKIIVE